MLMLKILIIKTLLRIVLIQCFFTFVFVVKIGVKTFQNIESNYNLFDLADKIINVN
jgi:hypothetical protein